MTLTDVGCAGELVPLAALGKTATSKEDGVRVGGSVTGRQAGCSPT